MRALWLWFLRQLHSLSMAIALWAKEQADILTTPAALPTPENRQPGQPPADWLARVQNASQPPAHWLEYIQSKTGQMPQMQDMTAIAQEQNPALPQVAQPQAQVNPVKPAARAETAPKWRKANPPKVVTVIDELPAPQSKEAALLSYQSPTNSHIPERLHWRIQKPSGKSVFEAPELQKSRETTASYSDLQETSAKPVDYAQPEKTQGKKPRYRLLKRRKALTPNHSAARSDSTPPSWRGKKISATSYQKPQSQTEENVPVYNKTEAAGKTEVAYSAPQVQADTKTDYIVPRSSDKSSASYQAPQAVEQGEASYRTPQETEANTANYRAPQAAEKGIAQYQTLANSASAESSFQNPVQPQQTPTQYPQPKSGLDAEAEYTKTEQSKAGSTSYSTTQETYRDNTPDLAAKPYREANGQAEGSPNSAKNTGKEAASEAAFSAAHSPKQNSPMAKYTAPKPGARTEAQYSQTQTAQTNMPDYQSPQSEFEDSGSLPHTVSSQNENAPQYTHAQQGRNAQSRFNRGAMLSDARSALANASADYWIALPSETELSDEAKVSPQQARLDAEQRGEF